MKILPQARNLCIGIALFLGITFDAEAQITQDYLQQFIEFITENQDGGEEFDYSEIGEQLDDWSRSPIDINSPEAAIPVSYTHLYIVPFVRDAGWIFLKTVIPTRKGTKAFLKGASQ